MYETFPIGQGMLATCLQVFFYSCRNWSNHRLYLCYGAIRRISKKVPPAGL